MDGDGAHVPSEEQSETAARRRRWSRRACLRLKRYPRRRPQPSRRVGHEASAKRATSVLTRIRLSSSVALRAGRRAQLGVDEKGRRAFTQQKCARVVSVSDALSDSTLPILPRVVSRKRHLIFIETLKSPRRTRIDRARGRTVCGMVQVHVHPYILHAVSQPCMACIPAKHKDFSRVHEDRER